MVIQIYTDGSCHTATKAGAWAAILFLENEKKDLSGLVLNTTHNRMELLAVIEAVSFIIEKNIQSKIVIYTDSQYVTRLPERKVIFSKNNYLSSKGTEIRNKDLVEKLIHYIQTYDITFVKVKAHQKKTSTVNPNREVDKMARKILREYIKKEN